MTIASKLHREGRIEVTDGLFTAPGYDRNRIYADTKLANVLFTRFLSARLAGSKRTAFCLHPGSAATGLLQSLAGESRLERLRTHVSRAVRRVEPWGVAACVEEVVRLAVADDAAPENGSYWEDGVPSEPSAPARDPELAARVWSASSTALRAWLDPVESDG